MQIQKKISMSPPFVSLEFFPPKKKDDWPSFLETAMRLKQLNPLFVSVTYGAGGSTQDNTLEICERLIRECDFEVMPHLTGVAADTEKINGFLDALQSLGIDNVLALRGDRPAGMTTPDEELFSTYPYASDLVRYVRQKCPQIGIGVAAFPEAHAESESIAGDLQVMQQKMEAGANFGITQLYFDNRVYFDYVQRLRDMGVTIPIIPGVLPIRNLASLRFILDLCNARVPGQLINAVMRADEKGGNKAVYEVGVNYARQQVRDLLANGAPGVHLYTLNKADMCLEVMEGLY
ncbi:methylenetetrahydrofolate reductase [Desulfogranum japonicum]|uniref:methylenetetrahydrofolate reductase n=1 Tax=Desulfogranum japonicum TaxID=231447 RepID=UPI0003FFBA02|nr:methylenetetrahydrofolate reductase [Desulfogranum japonicum]